ncbi:kinase-like protein [Auriscalpium vulgare]|uniref:Kinase-like protein n=1 Tax=Auriscalpium vulgare TaxID=40419 RepID=A0ACB8RA41_9AGAM|nr:kinase-like protein [Auriscalpium vulgare]
MSVPGRNPSPVFPPLNTFIDKHGLILVSFLAEGHDHVFYRAVESQPDGYREPRTYAVKCILPATSELSTAVTQRTRKQVQTEIAFHQLTYPHRRVDTLHRVVEEGGYVFLVTDYGPNSEALEDMRRCVGDSAFIKTLFLEIIDAVAFCHARGIAHCDLRPENVIRAGDGESVVLADFGYATVADGSSTEVLTPPSPHTSPELSDGSSRSHKRIPPRCSDVWSLGIILINLITGRNPWKVATPDDPVFQAYNQHPSTFLLDYLPISHKANMILRAALRVDWRVRVSLQSLRRAIVKTTTFYAEDVVFTQGMAKLSPEMEIGFARRFGSYSRDIAPSKYPYTLRDEDLGSDHSTSPTARRSLSRPHPSRMPSHPSAAHTGQPDSHFVYYDDSVGNPPVGVRLPSSSELVPRATASLIARLRGGDLYMSSLDSVATSATAATIESDASGVSYKTKKTVNSRKSKINQSFVPPGTLFLR